MAGPFFKVGAATNLASNTAWALSSGGTSGVGPPVAGETAIFDSLSGTVAGLTGALTVGNVTIRGIPANMTTGTGNVSIGAGGITFEATNSRAWLPSNATFTLSANQNWQIYTSAANTAALSFPAAAIVIAGSATVNVNALSGTQYVLTNSTGSSTFTGTWVLGAGVFLGGPNITNPYGTAASTIRFNENGSGYWNNSTVGATATVPSKLEILADASFNRGYITGGTPGTLVFTSAVTFDSAVTRTIAVDIATTISGAITGTAGFTKAGAGTLTLTANNTGLTGAVSVSEGALLAGSYTLPTIVLPAISSLTMTGTASVTLVNTATASNTYAYPITNNAPFVSAISSGSLAVGAFTPTGASAQEFTGTISGTGALVVSAAAAGVASLQYSRARTNSLPATLCLYVNTNPNQRYSIYEWAGGAADINTGTNIILERHATTTGAATLWYFYNTTAGEVTVNNVTKNSLSASAAFNATFTVGTTADVGDIKIAGVVSNGTDLGTLGVVKGGPRKLTLSANNTYTGTTTISGGTLSAQGIAGTRTPLGGSGAVTVTAVTGSGTLDISSTDTTASSVMSVNKAGTALSLGGTGTYQLTSTTGFNEYVCAGVTLNTTLPVNIAAGAYLRMGNTTAMSQSGGTWGITKTGDGEFDIGSFANTFAGVVTVSAGTLSFGATVPSGAASPLGNSTTAIPVTGTLKYNGSAAAAVGRSVTLTGATPSLDASGTGAVTFSAYTHAAGARTVTFAGSSTADNTFTQALTNNGVDAVALTKTGASKWILSAAPTYTGTTTVSAGELQFNGQTVSAHSGLVMNGTGKLSNTVLAGTGKTITCNGGTPEIEATTVGNTIAGTTAINAGSLRVTTEQVSGGKPVKVLGDTNVTVTSTLQTTKGINQRGRMTYGGDLTFNAGSTLRIG